MDYWINFYCLYWYHPDLSLPHFSYGLSQSPPNWSICSYPCPLPSGEQPWWSFWNLSNISSFSSPKSHNGSLFYSGVALHVLAFQILFDILFTTLIHLTVPLICQGGNHFRTFFWLSLLCGIRTFQMCLFSMRWGI